MALTDIKNFLRVDERLGTAGQPTEAQLGDAADSGYAAVINLGLLDPKYCLPDEAAVVASLGLEYRHIPVKFDAPTVEDFRAFVDTMDAWSGEKVFVHCAANFRVSSFVALYGELRLGWPRARADALAQALWQPNDVWAAFLERVRAEVIGG
ncbi:MAG TPA: protein tyrosine phosphatase family protein [Polyangia bacterium]|jgi:protein tyrosine phosphatase (PTP) superfamily phosphohydrolase (DUF442 family)|nr:protein tyrosine phosphatase family protein [Polyangia bacterium]